MNLEKWREWCKTRAPKLLAVLCRENEPLVTRCATLFIQNTRYYTESLREDIFQAARIGLLRAIEKWDPERGAFSTVAYFWMRHEMQGVTRHATPITRPKSADLPRRVQDAAAAHYARTGTVATAEDLLIARSAMKRAQAAQAEFVTDETTSGPAPATRGGSGEASVPRVPAELIETPEPEADIDRGRDVRALKVFVLRLPPAERRAFWAGERPELEAQAKAYVEARRLVR